MRITYYAPGLSGRPGTKAQPLECSWPELGKLLQARVTRHTCELVDGRCKHKLSGDAWSPVFSTGNRGNASVESIEALVYDLDDFSQEKLVSLAGRLEGRAYYVHSTHSHSPDTGKWALRLVLPLSEPFRRNGLHAATFKAHWRIAWANEAAKLGIEVDEAAKDPSRLYFFPALPEDAPFFWAEQEGAVTVLSHTPPVPEPSHMTQTTVAARVATSTLDGIRTALLSRGRNEERKHVKDWLDGAPLAPPGQQDPTAQSLCWKIARLAPDATEDQILILFGPCLRATEWGGPDDITDWFRTKLARAKSDVAEQVAQDRAKSEAQERELLGVMREEVPDAEPPDREWLQRLIQQGYRISKDGEPLKFKPEGYVVSEVLRHSPVWSGVFRFNKLANAIEYSDGPMPLPENNLDAVTSLVTNWFSANLGMHGLYETVVWSQIRSVAADNSFDPLMDYLNNLVWDGVPRIDRLFSDYIPTSSKSESGLDLKQYRAMVGRRWLLSAVARALNPGCKADSMVVLSGWGGRRKSMIGEILGGEWHTTYGPAEFGGKDAKLKLAQHWIVEIEELAAFDDKSKEAVKKDISERRATVRPAWGRAERLYPRRCVFYGTTNSRDFLTEDEGGYRRFWTIRVVQNIDAAKLQADRDQLWAEAVHVFKSSATCRDCSGTRCAAHRWWFESEEQFPVDEIATDNVAQDPIAQVIVDYYTARPTGTRPLHLRTGDIMRAMAVPAHQMTPALEARISRALIKLGFERQRVDVGGIPQNVFLPPKTLLAAPMKTQSTQGVA